MRQSYLETELAEVGAEERIVANTNRHARPHDGDGDDDVSAASSAKLFPERGTFENKNFPLLAESLKLQFLSE